ncbi:ATP-binding Cassette (ABC) Superfamily [Phytophthora infestans T30-4]|uniref:ATP-binding Cassette (ABC) Superfamily n=1 Tax=Phytophthora infestans (strain T30-4) TaxID=403677 RepID=D0MUB7_PHYIT|nr:ATP-binding Cassette (ABC) Superfamily [Phytophthora infestans T30-4]EEY61564.1 ATP-binding Cassette (ABC) Superfamily [Phytophthora infestans T30-4]|eukprot:XP_002908481.1 ATP-binding Cassette (ABC) Superfamily [Phytophthora infestans T30-4]
MSALENPSTCTRIPSAPVASAQSYILYQAVIFLVNMSYSAWFFFIASVCPNINVANPIALLSLLFLATFSGFLITKDTIPVYLSWIYWISPHGWGIHAVAVNQYRDSRWGNTCLVPSEKYWLWFGLVFLAGSYVFFMTLSCLALEFWRYETPKTISLDVESDKSEQ